MAFFFSLSAFKGEAFGSGQDQNLSFPEFPQGVVRLICSTSESEITHSAGCSSSCLRFPRFTPGSAQQCNPFCSFCFSSAMPLCLSLALGTTAFWASLMWTAAVTTWKWSVLPPFYNKIFRHWQRFDTRNTFRGIVFVEGHLEEPQCRSSPVLDDTASSTRNAQIRLAFRSCGINQTRHVSHCQKLPSILFWTG